MSHYSYVVQPMYMDNSELGFPVYMIWSMSKLVGFKGRY
jgi:hypothetical protein